MCAAQLVNCAPADRAPEISREGDRFRATPWRGGEPPGGWSSVFAVYAGGGDAPPLLGDYQHSGGAIVFTPRFAPQKDLTLRAQFRPQAGPLVLARFAGSAVELGPPPEISAVYPRTAVWPANTLKIYLQFSRPMAVGQQADHVRLLDQDGRPVPNAFVTIHQELWDAQGQRLTILFDPGRIKRGVGENLMSGEVLVPGRRFTLEVDPLRAADGATMSQPFRLGFTAGPDVRRIVDLTDWKISQPATATAPLRVDFGRPLDHALALDRIVVRRGATAIEGEARLEQDDRVWVFTPARPWAPGSYQLGADNELEDLAGNRPDRLFDRDEGRGEGIDPRPVLTRSFTVGF